MIITLIATARPAKYSALPTKSSTTSATVEPACASMGRFNQDFEPLTKAQAERIAEEIETAEHLKKLRAQRAA